MKPAGRGAQPKRMRWLGPLRGPVERFINGGPAPTDPLYLTNRTLGQRVRFMVVIAVPCLILAGGVILSTSNMFKPKIAPAKPLTAAEVAAKILPNLAKNISIESNKDIQVVEVHVDHTAGTRLAGTITNNTGRSIRLAEVVFVLTEASGSQLGAVTAKLENLAPYSTSKFAIPIQQASAAYALVREINTQ
ncbi:MAG: FxLYD domain-containing protein [Acidobacteriia bacterium]|nr:FxLYD domain-containing protein [Terriglobia bacterium]